MSVTKKLIEKVLGLSRVPKILFVDGDDERVLDAAFRLRGLNLVEPILLLKKTSKKTKNLCTIIVDENSDEFKFLVEKYIEKRKGKETSGQAINALKTRPFYGAMLLETNKVDGVIGGLVYATADILRAAFKSIGPKKGTSMISSVMLMHKDDDNFVFSDISVNVKPKDAEQLASIGSNAKDFALQMGIEIPKLAFLSFSTSQSAQTPETKLVEQARKIYNEKNPEFPAIGDVQFDAAFDPEIRDAKYQGESYKGKTNIYIFPDLNTGNIGYKIAQRLGHYGAIGPILVGVNKPMNDLSRGSSPEDVFNTSLLTALQTKENWGE